MKIAVDQVREALKEVVYFPKGDNIINLGMVEQIEVEGKNIRLTVLFSKMDDPAVNIIRNATLKKLKETFGADTHLNFNPVSEQERGLGPLAGVKNIIAVASGKGGVGKSTVAANLAVAFSKMGLQTGILDADIYGPSVPVMFGVEGQQPGVFEKGGKNRIIPVENYGIKIISIGFFVEADKALVWRGPMATNALNQLMNDVDWGHLDVLVLDLPPGTGDIQLTLAQSFPLDGAVFVTTPQKVAKADVLRAAVMFRQDKLKVPLLGLLENMSYFTPADQSNKKYYIFGEGRSQAFAEQLNIPLLGEIPILPQITESGDLGAPISLQENEVQSVFLSVAGKVWNQLHIKKN